MGPPPSSRRARKQAGRRAAVVALGPRVLAVDPVLKRLRLADPGESELLLKRPVERRAPRHAAGLALVLRREEQELPPRAVDHTLRGVLARSDLDLLDARAPFGRPRYPCELALELDGRMSRTTDDRKVNLAFPFADCLHLD